VPGAVTARASVGEKMSPDILTILYTTVINKEYAAAAATTTTTTATPF